MARPEERVTGRTSSDHRRLAGGPDGVAFGAGDPAEGRRPEAAAQPPRLLDQVRHECRVLHYALSTDETGVDWMRRFIFFHYVRHPREMGRSQRDRIANPTRNR